MEREIDYNKYSGKIMQLSLFYKYAKIAFATDEAMSSIVNEQMSNLLQFGKPYMIDKTEAGEARFKASVENRHFTIICDKIIDIP